MLDLVLDEGIGVFCVVFGVGYRTLNDWCIVSCQV